MANSFLDFLESMTIAMEADDITSQTANEVKSAVGETPTTSNDTESRKDEEDLNKVDDIFGTEKPQDGPSGDPEKDKAEGSEEIPPMEDEQATDNPDESEPNDMEDSNVSGDGGQDFQDNSADTSNKDLLFAKKNVIRDNLVQLYTVVSGDIEIVVNSLTNINDMNTINVMNAVLNNLRNCKDYIYKTLTQNLTSLDYDELLQRYITLKRVYDICVEMMDKYFNKDKKK